MRGGIAFLRELTGKYRNPVYVLAAYNAGERTILEAGGVPPIAETVGFVAAVLNDFYQWPALSSRVDAFAPAARLATTHLPASPQAGCRERQRGRVLARIARPKVGRAVSSRISIEGE